MINDLNLFLKPALWVLFTFFGNKAMAICTLISLAIFLLIPLAYYTFKGRRVKKMLYAEAVLISLAFIVGGWWFCGVVLFSVATYLACIWDFPVASLDTK